MLMKRHILNFTENKLEMKKMSKIKTIREIINLIINDNKNVSYQNFERGNNIVGKKTIDEKEVMAIWRGAQPHAHLPDNKFAGWNLYINEKNAENYPCKLLSKIKERLVLPK